MTAVEATSDTAIMPSMKEMKRDKLIAEVQRLLLEKGYVETGLVDGDMVPKGKTEDAILSFRNRNDLPLKPEIDDQFLKALRDAPAKEVPLRQIIESTAEVAPKVEAINKNLWTKFWAKIGTIPPLLTAMFLGIVNNLDEAITALSPLKLALSEWLDDVDKIQMLTYAGATIGVVSALMWFTSGGADSALKVGYRKGTVIDDNVHQKEEPVPPPPTDVE